MGDFRRQKCPYSLRTIWIFSTRNISHSELKPQRKWITEQTGMSFDRRKTWHKSSLSLPFNLALMFSFTYRNPTSGPQYVRGIQKRINFGFVFEENSGVEITCRTIVTAIVIKTENFPFRLNCFWFTWKRNVGVFKFLRVLERFRKDPFWGIYLDGRPYGRNAYPNTYVFERDPCQNCVFRCLWQCGRCFRLHVLERVQVSPEMYMWNTAKVMNIVIYVG